MPSLHTIASGSLFMAAAVMIPRDTPPRPVRLAHTITERRAPGHPMRYFVARPGGWTNDRTWPVLVVITDAYREFESTAQAFAAARGAGRFIIVVPEVLSGGAPAKAHATDFDYSAADWAFAERVGNCKFDDDGLAAVLRDVTDQDHGEQRVFITGWEAGGHVVFAQLFNHPERVRAAVAVTPNFQKRCVTEGRRVTGSVAATPIRVFHGADDTAWGSADRPWLVDQWHRADSLAKARGFTSVPDSLIPGEGHGAMPNAIIAYFTRLLGG